MTPTKLARDAPFARNLLAGGSIAFNPYPTSPGRRNFAAVRALLIGMALVGVCWYALVGLVIRG